MRMEELLDDYNVKQIIDEKLATGQKFELISLETGETVTDDELKQNIT